MTVPEDVGLRWIGVGLGAAGAAMLPGGHLGSAYDQAGPEAGSMVRLLAATVWLIVSGCAIVSQPPKLFADDSFRESDGVAYLWSAGKLKQPVFSMQDFAVVTQVDDAMIPSTHRPGGGNEPLVAWRIEIPAGNHLVQILNKETVICVASYLGFVCTVVEKSSHWVEFSAEPGRAYVPVVDEKCGRKWFWIVDLGQQPAAGGVKLSPLPFSGREPAAGGETPPHGPCQSLFTPGEGCAVLAAEDWTPSMFQ